MNMMQIGTSTNGRSRKGAWIEMSSMRSRARVITVAPARERGLKLEPYAAPPHRQRVAPARERGLK